MKSIILILILTLVLSVGITVYNSSSVIAADEGEIVLSMEGLDTATKGGTGTINLKINSKNDTIKIVSGKIIKDANVIDVKVESVNNWNCSYDKIAGKFLANKEAGTKDEEFLKITYTLSETAANEAIISVSDIKLTNDNSEEKVAIDVEKKIKVSEGTVTKILSKIEIVQNPTKTTYKIGEKFDKTGMKVKAVYSDGTEKEISNFSFSTAALTSEDKNVKIRYTENGITKENQVEIYVTATGEPSKDGEEKPKNEIKDNTITKNEIADTGLENNVVYGILAISFVAVASYVAYKKYSIV